MKQDSPKNCTGDELSVVANTPAGRRGALLWVGLPGRAQVGLFSCSLVSQTCYNLTCHLAGSFNFCGGVRIKGALPSKKAQVVGVGSCLA